MDLDPVGRDVPRVFAGVHGDVGGALSPRRVLEEPHVAVAPDPGVLGVGGRPHAVIPRQTSGSGAGNNNLRVPCADGAETVVLGAGVEHDRLQNERPLLGAGGRQNLLSIEGAGHGVGRIEDSGAVHGYRGARVLGYLL